MTIYERLALMAVSYKQVTDKRSLPGVIAHAFPEERWVAADGADAGCIALFLDARPSNAVFRDNIAVIITRFIFDHGVKPADLIDHAYVDARALGSWREQSVKRWPAHGRHSGWALQTGTYTLDSQSLFAATAYVVHERGNVGYLMQTTATVLDAPVDAGGHPDLIAAVQTVNFVD